MNAKKLRRKLIFLCLGLFTAWILFTFVLIVTWYAKGGLVSGGGLTAADAVMVMHTFIFRIIPAIASGYLLFGLFALKFILESKRCDDDSNHDA